MNGISEIMRYALSEIMRYALSALTCQVALALASSPHSCSAAPEGGPGRAHSVSCVALTLLADVGRAPVRILYHLTRIAPPLLLPSHGRHWLVATRFQNACASYWAGLLSLVPTETRACPDAEAARVAAKVQAAVRHVRQVYRRLRMARCLARASNETCRAALPVVDPCSASSKPVHTQSTQAVRRLRPKPGHPAVVTGARRPPME